jgi:hypothetical protein
MADPHSAEAIRERWIAMGLSTKPVDKVACQKKIEIAYSYAGLEIPRQFMWFPSPASALIGIASLKADDKRAILVTDGIRHQVHNEVFQDAIGAFDEHFSAKVGRGNGRDVLNMVRDQVVQRVREQLLAQLTDQVRNVYSHQILHQVKNRMGEAMYEGVTAAARKQIRNFEDLENEALGLLEMLIIGLRHCRWGWSEDYWLAAHEASMRQGATQPSQAVLNRFLSLVQIREHISIFFPFADLVVCCENPLVVARDDRNRLHSPDGPAVIYRDGWGVWAWHGVRVPKNVIEEPGKITIQEIETQENAEIRRVTIERMGWERFIKGARLRPVQSDDWGTLYRKDLQGDPEPLMLVKVTNSTAEPDGSYKDYVLRVHHELRPLLEGNILGDPQALTALNAIASTFGLRGDEYKKVLVQT